MGLIDVCDQIQKMMVPGAVSIPPTVHSSFTSYLKLMNLCLSGVNKEVWIGARVPVTNYFMAHTEPEIASAQPFTVDVGRFWQPIGWMEFNNGLNVGVLFKVIKPHGLMVVHPFYSSADRRWVPNIAYAVVSTRSMFCELPKPLLQQHRISEDAIGNTEILTICDRNLIDDKSFQFYCEVAEVSVEMLWKFACITDRTDSHFKHEVLSGEEIKRRDGCEKKVKSFLLVSGSLKGKVIGTYDCVVCKDTGIVSSGEISWECGCKRVQDIRNKKSAFKETAATT